MYEVGFCNPTSDFQLPPSDLKDNDCSKTIHEE